MKFQDGPAHAMTMVMPFAASSVPGARHDLHRWLSSRGLGSDLVDTAVLVMTELLGNAVRHARPMPEGTLQVRSALAGEDLQISVSDGGGGDGPRMRHVSPLATEGRGIALVDSLTDAWWCESSSAGRTVHAILPVG
ncbi:MAG TPA: ATP-binding protein [Nocardioidaceae bacterium]|nr:ATP-binding protein [Nocardioidaceae bacterium]